MAKSPSVKAVIASAICLALHLAGAGLLCGDSAASPGRAPALKAFIEKYIQLSNQRNLQGLASLYAPQPVVIQEGEPLEGDFMDNLVENLETWDRYEVEWSILEIGRIDVQPDKAVLEFRIEGRGKAWFIPVTRSFEKRLVVRPAEEGGWKIEKDITH